MARATFLRLSNGSQGLEGPLGSFPTSLAPLGAFIKLPVERVVHDCIIVPFPEFCRNFLCVGILW